MEDDLLLLLLLLRICRKSRTRRRSLKCASSRFSVEKIFKKLGECHRFVQELQNEDMEHFSEREIVSNPNKIYDLQQYLFIYYLLFRSLFVLGKTPIYNKV